MHRKNLLNSGKAILVFHFTNKDLEKNEEITNKEYLRPLDIQVLQVGYLIIFCNLSELNNHLYHRKYSQRVIFKSPYCMRN